MAWIPQEEESAVLNIEEQSQWPDINESGVQISADMNGNIWKILVKPGDEVTKRQPLIIVEAMKMKLVIYAPQSGRIKRISCQPGNTVNPGDALLWLEPESI
ncbi:acetyl-CoA carboxylase biotin carboxyl carrier protein subunit [Xenorhabdus sp. NBAII XenSa04]|uniref:acetyl-CoA carboxylase biotin carboxyl carrier protein subunit n=1 Tax=Xenorhabdus TaxID=626 RepID=UPI000AC60787